MLWLLRDRAIRIANCLIQKSEHALAGPTKREAARAESVDSGRDERAREQVRGDGADARGGPCRHLRAGGCLGRRCRCEFTCFAAPTEDTCNTTLHPYDVHRENAGKGNSGDPAPACVVGAPAIGHGHLDVQNYAREEENGGKELQGGSR